MSTHTKEPSMHKIESDTLTNKKSNGNDFTVPKEGKQVYIKDLLSEAKVGKKVTLFG